jgi:hypothetical protein
MDTLDLEIRKYVQLVELYPTNKLYCPDDFNEKIKTSNISKNIFDVNLTRYLYIKTFNSIPPDDIWHFKRLLGIQQKDIKHKEKTCTLEVKIGILKNDKLQTDIINLEVNPTDSFDKINSELKFKGLDCKLLLNGTFLIDPKSKIGDIKTIYAVCL